jgi:hypothetical protein
MPSLANMTVKKNDTTTDVTFTGVQPAAGDRAPAVWRNESVGVAVNHRPRLTMQSRANGNGTARKVEVVLTYPSTYVDSTTGRTQVADVAILRVDATLPVNMPVADINEAVAQFGNLLDHTLVQDCLKAGYAAS